MTANAVFFVSQMGEAQSKIRRRARRVVRTLVEPAAREVGLCVVWGDSQPAPFRITQWMMEQLVQATVVVCDLTGRNPNVFYELGVAHAFGRPVILLTDSVAELPFDVRDEAVIEIGKAVPVDPAALARKLADSLRLVTAPAFVPRSPVSEYVGTVVPAAAAGSALPRPLIAAMVRNVADAPVHKLWQRSTVDVRRIDAGMVELGISLEYELVNRSRRYETYNVGLLPDRPMRAFAATADGASLHVDRDYLTARGVSIPRTLKPESSEVIELSAQIDFRDTDSELMVTHIASLDYELRLTGHHRSLDMTVQSLLPSKAKVSHLDGGGLLYKPDAAVLPHQGFRLYWRRRDVTHEHAQ